MNIQWYGKQNIDIDEKSLPSVNISASGTIYFDKQVAEDNKMRGTKFLTCYLSENKKVLAFKVVENKSENSFQINNTKKTHADIYEFLYKYNLLPKQTNRYPVFKGENNDFFYILP